MNEILKVVLSLSLSGSLLMLVLLLCKPLLRNKIGKGWQYYIWLVVIARLLLPFAPETSLVGGLFLMAEQGAAQTETAPDYVVEQNIAPVPQTEANTGLEGVTAPPQGKAQTAVMVTVQRIFTYTLQNLWLVWLVVALILLIRKVTTYQGFVRYVRAGRAEVSDTDILDRLAVMGEQWGVKRPVELYTNSLISSPLLLGFFRPCIVLPTADLPKDDFEYIILHELTHYRRRDMFYKWLVQLTVCLHWFNPLVYLMGREVSRACELACDEGVISKLDVKKQRAYGDTLLNATATGGDYRDSLASMTLSESKELLKERLAAIMKFKKSTTTMACVSGLLAVGFLCGAAFAGAYRAENIVPQKGEDIAEKTGASIN